MQTELNGITIDYNEYTGEWTVIDWGNDEDSPRNFEERADYMEEFHDDINKHVDRLCRENAAGVAEVDAAVRADTLKDMRNGL